MMLPVQRVEMVTDDLGMSATIGPLYARHRPRVRRIARPRIDVGLRAAAAGALLFPLGAQFAVIGRSAAVPLRIPLEAAPVPYLRGPGRVPATAARRAADVIDGHACRPLTLADIAAYWGFTRLDRFAAAYRTVYGRPPSHILRH
jgi:AraC-like DNA-binding protein